MDDTCVNYDCFENHFIPEARQNLNSVGLPDDTKIVPIVDDCWTRISLKVLMKDDVSMLFFPANVKEEICAHIFTDIFFLPLTDPQYAEEFPMDYLEKVKKVHSVGGYGSQGYQYDWKLEEAKKNLLRTHTTGVSARMLYALANQEEFSPVKYFSIDKVYRNETLDATHLAEFHQIEGVIADYGLTLGDLIGVLHQFFSKLGIRKLRFKPAYNPYTEPSMEIFSYHDGLKKWVEVGNSGMFRPEMLLPMGLSEDVSVIAWGLSLERPTMIKYKIDNIRELVGHRVNLNMVNSNPICRLEK
ncbi:phenylalanine--tRNA ligase alpha subunit-like [Stegodyphus dumicola]|uniref:phenylalanine--tRNA ligase alpha subunit-like n=1 Tax=Stegodyphus dumicola TaxID=202533 RepID=UPI0015B2C899|nr:phenylalanine--tRNA ligase alpha subunit-like [Stegodyphus dumicola]